MDILKECAELAKKHEGLYTLKDDGLVYAYHDPVGYPTIGYGNLLSMVKYGDLSQYKPKTVEECEKDLEQELAKKSAIVLSMSPVLAKPENAYRLVAITDFAFNLGEGNYKKSTLKKRIDAEDWESAVVEIKKWDKAGGKVMGGLVKRRADEAALLVREVGNA